ncbi:hypothetical protein OLMES_1734 [Oleiphilus messinensis]|uniref:DUF4136 domain-containing protein n=1 Tax=Oleiphilus messinensis TaxID=141451 RepID=A0A1Y0I6J6_9GAMM|nr:DUF4136 domain-containing protein [Oleiphilus messinensis]ARU55809.1 hypothetical protein OLMES_1734 [Oleiphilus messinensis]
MRDLINTDRPVRRAINPSLIYAFALVWGLSLLSGCQSFEILNDRNSAASFQNLKTYAFVRTDPERRITESESQQAEQSWPVSLDEGRVRQALQRVLQQKGYEYRPGEEVDMLVRVKIENELRFRARPLAQPLISSRFRDFPGGGDVTWEPYQGTQIVIEVQDRSEQVILWQGKARSPGFDKMSPRKRDQEVARQVDAMLKSFPAALEN